MTELKNEEMILVKGGAISSQLINSLVKAGTFIYTIGQATGSAIRRWGSGIYCPVA